MQTVFTIFKEYGGTGYYTILYLVALIYLGMTEEDKRIKTLFVYVPATIQILFFIPYFYAIYNHLDEGTYYRILWLIPMSVIIAYSGCKLVGRHSKTAVCFMTILLVLSGTYVYKSGYMTRAENLYHLPQETIELCDMIKPAEGQERVWAAFPVEQIHFVRQYTTDIQMPFGRDSLVESWDHMPSVMYDLYNEPVISLEKLVEATGNEYPLKYPINYFVFLKEKPLEGDSEDYDMTFVGETTNYVVYRYNAMPLP